MSVLSAWCSVGYVQMSSDNCYVAMLRSVNSLPGVLLVIPVSLAGCNVGYDE